MFNNYRRIFQNRPFRLFWFGFSFSVLGDSLSRIALTWYVYDHTKSAEALGWLAFWYTGPVIIGGLIAGSLLDRFDRRTVMVVDNVIRGTAMTCIPILHVLGLLAVWHIYVVAALYGLLMMIALAGSPSLIPDLVAKDSLDTANALETLSWTVGGVVGPALAGWLIAYIGAPNVIIIDALSYFAFAIALWQIHLPPTAQAATEKPRYTLADAFKLLTNHKILFSTTFMFLAANIGAGGFMSVWLPILADQTLKGGPDLFGILYSVWAAGEVISSLLVGSRQWRWPLGLLICFAQILSGLAITLMIFNINLWSVMIGLGLLGLFSAPLTIWAQTLRMQIIPEELRGRTFALLRTLMQSGNPIGGMLAGALFPLIGMTALIALTAGVVGVPGLLGLQVRDLRQGTSRI